MDDSPVPNPQSVEVISLAVAERVDAIVEMNTPGVWVLGSTLESSRQMGLGIVVEYAGKTGTPIWKDPVFNRVGLHSVRRRRRRLRSPMGHSRPHFPRFASPTNGSQFDAWTINNEILAGH